MSVIIILAVFALANYFTATNDVRAKNSFILSFASGEELNNNTVFPEDKAGLTAYINVGSLEYEKILEVSKQTMTILDTDSKSYVFGEITVSGSANDASWNDKVYLYIDTNGWLVSFFPRDKPASALIRWTGGDYNSHSTNSSDNTLEVALKELMDNMGVDFYSAKPNIEYYDFAHPEATNYLYFIAYGTKTVSFIVPENKEISEVSYNVIDNDWAGDSSISLTNYVNGSPDEQAIVTLDESRELGFIEEDPISSTEEFVKPGGLGVGETFNVTVSNNPILDQNGDGVVNTDDLTVDTSSVSVAGIDAIPGVVTIKVEQYSSVNTTFSLTYTGSKMFPVYPEFLYELNNKQGLSGDLSTAIVIMYSEGTA